MLGHFVDDEGASPRNKIGSARTSKKQRRKHVPFAEWSAEQESIESRPTGVQQQAPDLEGGDGASPGFSGETNAPDISPSTSETTAPQNLPPPDDRDEDVSFPEPQLPTRVQQEAPDVENGDGASPGFSGETNAPEITAPPNLPSPDDQDEDVSFPEPQLPTGVQQEARDGASPGLSGETNAPELSASTTEFTAPQNFSLSDEQDEDVSFPEPPVLTTSEYMEDKFELQSAQEEQHADDWPSENIRVNAPNIRYGGYQPAPQNRNTPLGSGRLQNTTKLGRLNFCHFGLYNGTLTLLELAR
ncbi:hypothetical protein IMSHALPRED_000834 [Imshaugia aleurites]|uniref:Uncharacterized protein n=1 Tax=Imshaugia aleurites TaxID=172621 RepID=A0A8H3J0P7_9LECA|nr:hypothetical protein IMSHALPRED_000834 [Imshaugia aleurites]